jgi:hypothetical protein
LSVIDGVLVIELERLAISDADISVFCFGVRVKHGYSIRVHELLVERESIRHSHI